MTNFDFEDIKEPSIVGSYKKDDVIFLLTDIGEKVQELSTEKREELIQNGGHYSKMLPIEYEPTLEYINLFHDILKKTSGKVAKAVAIVSENIIKRHGENLVLVSLARAGTPIGILIKRYIKKKYNVDLNHYSISIIRDVGIDEQGIKYILKNNPGKKIQFIDGWTGKGVINNVLINHISEFNKKFDTNIKAELAVLADPGHCVNNFGTREDFLIPSACLNATVSGLISRTYYNEDIIKENDFHGGKFYKDWKAVDLSNFFVDEITSHFNKFILGNNEKPICETLMNLGLQDVLAIQKKYDIKDINLIKPGVGETTRVLLRRVPWKILVKDFKNENIKHILLLAKEKKVLVEEFKNMKYATCGLIQKKSKKN
jgi:hypothetical protein